MIGFPNNACSKVKNMAKKQLNYSEILPYHHLKYYGHLAVTATFLAAWPNRHTFSCKKTLINKVTK